jgi:hypothetical protein
MNTTHKALSVFRHSAFALAAFVAIASTAASAEPLAQPQTTLAPNGVISTAVVTLPESIRRWFPGEPRRIGG